MKLVLYVCKDSSNVIGKKLDRVKDYNITFKGDGDLIRPTIYLTVDGIPKCNYAYIPEFGRYYFINNITMAKNKLVRLELECDVLESFKDDILKSKAIIIEDKVGNPWLDDGKYQTEVRNDIERYESNVTLEKGNYIVLSSYKGEGVEEVDS